MKIAVSAGYRTWQIDSLFGSIFHEMNSCFDRNTDSEHLSGVGWITLTVKVVEKEIKGAGWGVGKVKFLSGRKLVAADVEINKCTWYGMGNADIRSGMANVIKEALEVIEDRISKRCDAHSARLFRKSVGMAMFEFVDGHCG